MRGTEIICLPVLGHNFVSIFVLDLVPAIKLAGTYVAELSPWPGTQF